MSLRIVRAALAGVASGLLCLVLLVRLTLELDVRLLTAEVLLPALVFFAAVAAGAVAGWRGRRGSSRGPGRDVALACGLTVGGLSALSLGLALALGTTVESELAELSAILVGVVLGAWGQAKLSEVLAAGDGQHGQTASEYLGLILVVSVIIAALSSLGPSITQMVRDVMDRVDSGQGLQTGRADSASAAPGRDGPVAPGGEARGGGSAPVVQPLTQENASRPWERIGVSEEEWKQLEKAILGEVNPGGVEGFLTGAGPGGVTLDENGKLRVVLAREKLLAYVKDGKLEAAEYQENGAAGGLAKALLKLAGASGTKTLAKALTKLPPGLRERFGRFGILPSTKNGARPPSSTARPTLKEPRSPTEINTSGLPNSTRWGPVWGRGEADARRLIGTRDATQLRNLGLDEATARELGRFYRLAAKRGQGSTTAPARADLMEHIADVLKASG